MYVQDLSNEAWKSDQPETQFQGERSSHELAAILLTECIQHSQYTLRRPLYVLYLDAKSAFDYVQKELLIKNLFFVQNADQRITYFNNRLSSRRTFVDWEGTIMGPIHDVQGLEQGGG